MRFTDPAKFVFEKIKSLGLEVLTNRYYGTYKGIVVDTEDPENRNRVRVMVPDLGYDTKGKVPTDWWAEPDMLGCTGNFKDDKNYLNGVFFPPEKYDYVWVKFEHGDIEEPVYTGGHLPDNKPAGRDDFFDKDNKIKGIRTKAGNKIKINDKDGEISIDIIKGKGNNEESDLSIKLNSDDTVEINRGDEQIKLSEGEILAKNKSGAEAKLSQSGVSLSKGNSSFDISDSGISIKGTNIELEGAKIDFSSSNVVMGKGLKEAVLTKRSADTFNFHTHIGNSGAPTSPPSVQITPGNGISLTTKSN